MKVKTRELGWRVGAEMGGRVEERDWMGGGTLPRWIGGRLRFKNTRGINTSGLVVDDHITTARADSKNNQVVLCGFVRPSDNAHWGYAGRR